MRFTSLRLRNFRSYSDYSVELDKGVNIVVGPNASGKTNLLEAVAVLSSGVSYRGNDNELIKFGRPWADIEGLLNNNQKRRLTIRRQDEKTAKSIIIDDLPLSRMVLSRTIPLTLFEPEHLRMVSGSPERRRDYIDGILIQTQVGYGGLMRRYRRALAQRNYLLKQTAMSTKDQLFVWDVKLGELGKKIYESRMRVIDAVNKNSSRIYGSLSGRRTSVKLQYLSPIKDVDYGSFMLRSLQNNHQLDRERGFTSVGPHREDIRFLIDRHDALHSASRGEGRTLVLMLKLVELQLLEAVRDSKPLLLLDDVFSELDASRRRALTEHLKDYQTIITTTDADAIIKHFLSGYNVIALTNKNT